MSGFLRVARRRRGATTPPAATVRRVALLGTYGPTSAWGVGGTSTTTSTLTLTAPAAASDVCMTFGNLNGLAPGPAALTYAATLDGVPLTWGGASSVTITPGTLATADPIATMAAGSHTLITSTTGSVDGQNHPERRGPVSATGVRIATPAVLVVGDSIGFGVGDTGSFALYPSNGFASRGLTASGVPFANHSFSGSTPAQWVLDRILPADPGATHLLLQVGINGISGSASWSAVATERLRIATDAKARGMQVIQTTLSPNPGRYGIAETNAWVRGGAPIVDGAPVTVGTTGAILAGDAAHPMAGYLDVAAAVEVAATADPQWVTGAIDAGDTLHPNGTGHGLMAAVVQTWAQALA